MFSQRAESSFRRPRRLTADFHRHQGQARAGRVLARRQYNPIERCWGILERHRNGTLIDSATTAMNWAATMTWKGFRPVVQLLETTYDKGIRVA
ncbi:MAG: hypothetical protein IT427_02325, partial [Pirellulales bacterium]|nr:hypothetical protein [Pirellulales bacterium]